MIPSDGTGDAGLHGLASFVREMDATRPVKGRDKRPQRLVAAVGQWAVPPVRQRPSGRPAARSAGKNARPWGRP